MKLLYEREGLRGFGIPEVLASGYGGDLGVPALYGNFVASVDGVVALHTAGESGAIISGHSQADRFLMGLLRACADAVLIGAGTLRAAAPGDLWTPEHIFPQPAFAELRQKLGLAPQPQLYVVSGSGDVDLSHDALRQGGIVVTTQRGKARLEGRARLLVLEHDPIAPAALVQALRAAGCARILTEGGPTLFGELIAAGLLDELFLTVSPALFGRFQGDGRKPLVQGVDLHGAKLELLSARQEDSHLFLRYACRR